MESGLLGESDCKRPLRIRTEPIGDFYAVEPRPFARGKFATVRRCRQLSSGAELAAKYVRVRRRAADVRAEILHEARVLALAGQHPHIVQLHEVYEAPSEIVLVLELVSGGEVQRVLDDEEALGEADTTRLLRQILDGLSFLHRHNIAHLDLKPQNLLLTADFPAGEVKLCDFGISRLISKGVEIREIVGTPDYVAPEILHYEPISLATDMWSVGVLTYVLLSGHSPFGGDSKQETFCNITRGQLDFPADLFPTTSAQARDFITRLLRRDPKERMTVEECLSHPWLVTPDTVTPGIELTLTPVNQPECQSPEATSSNSPLAKKLASTDVTKCESAIHQASDSKQDISKTDISHSNAENNTSDVNVNGTSDILVNNTSGIAVNEISLGMANDTSGTVNDTSNIVKDTSDIIAKDTSNVIANDTSDIIANGTSDVILNGTRDIIVNGNTDITVTGTCGIASKDTIAILANSTNDVTVDSKCITVNQPIGASGSQKENMPKAAVATVNDRLLPTVQTHTVEVNSTGIIEPPSVAANDKNLNNSTQPEVVVESKPINGKETQQEEAMDTHTCAESGIHPITGSLWQSSMGNVLIEKHPNEVEVMDVQPSVDITTKTTTLKQNKMHSFTNGAPPLNTSAPVNGLMSGLVDQKNLLSRSLEDSGINMNGFSRLKSQIEAMENRNEFSRLRSQIDAIERRNRSRSPKLLRSSMENFNFKSPTSDGVEQKGKTVFLHKISTAGGHGNRILTESTNGLLDFNSNSIFGKTTAKDITFSKSSLVSSQHKSSSFGSKTLRNTLERKSDIVLGKSASGAFDNVSFSESTYERRSTTFSSKVASDPVIVSPETMTNGVDIEPPRNVDAMVSQFEGLSKRIVFSDEIIVDERMGIVY